MQIKNKVVVSLDYELRTEGFESEIEEKTDSDHPLEFIYGMGMMIQKFEDNLKGLEIGNEFSFKIDAVDGYGLHEAENVIALPKRVFEKDGEIQNDLLVVGKILPMQDNTGHNFNGKVLEVNEDTVKMDFNHPMAGKDLYFTGKIKNLRVATPEELDHGHVHSHGHHHHH